MQKDAVKGPVKRASVKTLKVTVQYLSEELIHDVQAALKAVEELPGGEQEAAVKLLCEALAEAKAQVLAWANDHGEP